MPDQRALAQLLRLGSAPQENALLQAEMQRAAQLAQPRSRQYGTAGGAIMGALSDGVRGMVGGFRQNDLARQAKEAMAGEVDARQQWLTADAQKRAAARAALLRGQPPPADAMPLEQSPQEQAAGMAAALRGEPAQAPAASDALTKLTPYQPGPLLGGGAAPAGTPSAPLAPLAGPGGQSAPIGGPMPGDALRAKLTQTAPYQAPAIDRNPSAFAPDRFGVTLPTPTREMERSRRPPEAKMSAPAVAPPAPAQAELPDLSPEQYAEIAIASGDPAMMAWGKTVLEQANLRDAMGAKRQEGEAKAKVDADAAAAKQKAEADKFGHEQRDKLMAIPMVRSALDSRMALDQIQKAAAQKSAMGDIAMVYGVITTFDPKSGVKEGEIALSAEAQGFISKLESTLERLKSGARLTDTVRADILETAKNMYLARSAPALKLASEYDGYLARAGLNPKEYLPDLGFSSTPKAPKSAKDTQQDVSKLSDDELKELAGGK